MGLVVTALLAVGCQGEYRTDAQKLDRIWTTGNYEEAATFAYVEAMEESRHRKNRVVYFLEAGRTAQAAGDYRTSSQSFDLAFVDTFPYLSEAPEATVSEAIVTTVGNDTMARYRGTPNDRIMLHALNSLNFMAMGDMPAARVELNRALLWHDDALTRYAEAIDLATKKNKKNVDAEGDKWKRKAGSEAWSKNSNKVVHGNTASILNEHYRDLPADIGDATYGNAFATHLRGIFRLARRDRDADLSGARFDLRAVAGMVPSLGEHLSTDLATVEGEIDLTPTTWVYYFSGQAPELEQVKLSVPLPLPGAFTMPTLALPKLVFEKSALSPLHVAADSDVTTTLLLSNTSMTAGAQFRQRLPIIISQELVRATGKSVATYVAMQLAEQQQSAIAMVFAVGMVAYQYGSAQADLRTWHTLPSEIQVARIATPKSGRIALSHADGKSLGVAEVIPNECNIVVVSMPSAAAPTASVMAIQLTGELRPFVEIFDLQHTPDPQTEADTVDSTYEPVEEVSPGEVPSADTRPAASGVVALLIASGSTPILAV